MKSYGAQFLQQHEQMILQCIPIMENKSRSYLTFMERDESLKKMLTNTLSRITTGKLARLILNCTDTIRAKKNWNSHGATVGSAICQLSLIISSLSNTSVCELDANFIELIPHGVVHTGYKYGNHDICHTEYMASTVESRVIVGGDEVYLNPSKFKSQSMGVIL